MRTPLEEEIRTPLRSKAKEWARRYALPELAGTVGNFIGPYFAAQQDDSALLAGFASAALGNALYAGTLLAEQIAQDMRTARAASEPYGARGAAASAAKVAAEIGPPMAIDTFLTRTPITTFAIENAGQVYGTIIGKVASDFIWYAQAIGIYEAMGKYTRRRVALRGE